MTFDLRRTVFSKLSRRRMCNCSFDSQNVLPMRVEVLELSTSPEAKEQIHVLFFCLLSKHWLLHLSTLPNSSKWIFLWAGLFLYRHLPWSLPKKKKHYLTFLLVLPRIKKICSLNTCWLHAMLVMSNATVLFCEFVPHFSVVLCPSQSKLCFLSCWSGTFTPSHYDMFKVLHIIDDLYRCCCNLCVKEYL